MPDILLSPTFRYQLLSGWHCRMGPRAVTLDQHMVYLLHWQEGCLYTWQSISCLHSLPHSLFFPPLHSTAHVANDLSENTTWPAMVLHSEFRSNTQSHPCTFHPAAPSFHRASQSHSRKLHCFLMPTVWWGWLLPSCLKTVWSLLFLFPTRHLSLLS